MYREKGTYMYIYNRLLGMRSIVKTLVNQVNRNVVSQHIYFLQPGQLEQEPVDEVQVQPEPPHLPPQPSLELRTISHNIVCILIFMTDNIKKMYFLD